MGTSRRQHRLYALWLLASATMIGWVSAGCSEPLLVYTFEGQHYDEQNDCLAEELVIDVIEGEATGTCEGVRCIRSVENGDHYVTDACEVPELYEDLTDAEDGPCALALAAYEREDEGLCP